MIEYSAALEYEVFSDGRAKVIEKKHIHNHSDSPVEREKYCDTLPPDVAIDTIKCYRTIGDQNRVELKKNISEIQGTNRKLLTITNLDGSPLKLHPGTTTFTMEFYRNNFYFLTDKVFSFYFHHSLPKLYYLINKTVPKTIKLKINKPFSRFLYSYSIYSIHKPFGYNSESEANFDKTIELEYKFDLTNDNHYFNTVFIVKNFRLPHFNLISYITKQYLKTRGVSK
jgi:hypothetical protein